MFSLNRKCFNKIWSKMLAWTFMCSYCEKCGRHVLPWRSCWCTIFKTRSFQIGKARTVKNSHMTLFCSTPLFFRESGALRTVNGAVWVWWAWGMVAKLIWGRIWRVCRSVAALVYANYMYVWMKLTLFHQSFKISKRNLIYTVLL